MSEISKLTPTEVWKNFDMICSYPHPSKHEEKLVAAVMDFAKEHGLESFRDEIGNVIIRKPATPGMENRKGVILQAHLDMVPQKNNSVQHDFEKDPIIPMIDGEWVRAKGTTLGADNGMGVAAALAVLASKNLAHGPIEALLTIDEETGMTGAFGLKAGILNGDILLNLDSETEGELYVGCAGGIDASATFTFKPEPSCSEMEAFNFKVSGLKGGHSGMDIILGRGNANKIIFRCLKGLAEKFGMRLCRIEGGNMRNAIPREADAEILIPKDQVQAAKEYAEQCYNTIKSELSLVEPGFMMCLEPIARPKEMMDMRSQTNLINAIYSCPNGVFRMSDSMPGLVETSSNMAIVKSEKNIVSAHFLLRSSVDSAKMDLAEMLRSVMQLAGAEIEFSGAYPGWRPDMNSAILKLMQEVYHKLYGKEPAVMAIHAGLECGLLGGVYPHWDMVSFGPTIQSPHSPDERVNIESVSRFWNFLVETLKHISAK